MVESKTGVMVDVGDWVGDPLDGWEKRKVEEIREEDGGYTLYMRDGGVMGLDEVDRDYIWLPGEIEGFD